MTGIYEIPPTGVTELDESFTAAHQSAADEEEKIEAARQAQISEISEEIDPLFESMIETPIPSAKLPQSPNLHGKPGKEFFAASGLLLAAALFGSAKMRLGAKGAMNSLSAGLQGLYQGRKEATHQVAEQYKVDLQNALVEHKLEMEKYNAVMNNSKLTLQQKWNELKLIGKQYDSMLVQNGKTYQQTVSGILQSKRIGDAIQKHIDNIEQRILDRAARNKDKKKRSLSDLQNASMPPEARQKVIDANGEIITFSNGKKFKYENNEIIEVFGE